VCSHTLNLNSIFYKRRSWRVAVAGKQCYVGSVKQSTSRSIHRQLKVTILIHKALEVNGNVNNMVTLGDNRSTLLGNDCFYISDVLTFITLANHDEYKTPIRL
jgi:hypothetical protein